MTHLRLTHLNALRAFEAVARHMSFVRASRELSITAGALSQQVRLLEDYYGAKLFRRHNRRISLTDAGAAVLPDLRLGFDYLSAVTARLRTDSTEEMMTVSAPPTFAAKWLVRRLGGFAGAHPTIRINLESTDRLVDLRREDVDIAVRYGHGKWPGLRAEMLVSEHLTPACAPNYLQGFGLHRPADLARASLIHDRTMGTDPGFPTWATWFEAAGLNGVKVQGGLTFSSSITAIQAAVDGHGVILARSVTIEEELENGRLVLPFPDARLAGQAYYVAYLPETLKARKVAAFRAWILEAAHNGALPDGSAAP